MLNCHRSIAHISIIWRWYRLVLVIEMHAHKRLEVAGHREHGEQAEFDELIETLGPVALTLEFDGWGRRANRAPHTTVTHALDGLREESARCVWAALQRHGKWEAVAH